MMTLDDAIKHAEEVAKESQKAVDTGIIFDGVTIDMIYCDDTEVIEEHLANWQKCADENKQIAEWFKELKQFKESAISLDRIREARDEIENLTPWDEGLVEMHEVLEILDKLIESEEK